MNLSRILILLAVSQLSLAPGFAATLAPAPPPAPPAQTAAAPAPAVLPAQQRAAVPAQTAAPADDIRDIRGPISIAYSWLWAANVLGGLALAAALYGVWRWYRAPARERAREPAEIALERLAKARELMSRDRGREYSFAVSEITRTYIEARFHERAARRTTEEFLRDLLRRAETPLAQHRALLEDFLQYCDLAKFAQWYLTPSDMESMHESARAFILATQPQPVTKETFARPANPGPEQAAEPQLTRTRP